MTKGWIWPNDRHKRRGFRRGFWDIMTGKGPDMYVGDLGDAPPDWTEWGRWPQYGAAEPYRYDDSERTPPWARRGYQSYDPKARRYKKHYPHPALGVLPPAYRGDDALRDDLRWGGDPDVRYVRRRRTSMPQSRAEVLRDWTPVPIVAAKPDNWVWGPRAPSTRFYSPSVSSVSELSTDNDTWTTAHSHW